MAVVRHYNFKDDIKNQIKENNKRPTHRCDICGRQAVVHYQNCVVKWDIKDDEIDLDTEEFISGSDSEYYCERHYP